MTKKHLETRRARNRALAKADRANRCEHCRLAFDGLTIQDFGEGTKFCSEACFQAAAEVARLKAARSC